MLFVLFKIFIDPLTYDLWLNLSQDVLRTVGTITLSFFYQHLFYKQLALGRQIAKQL